MDATYPKSHILRIAALDSLAALLGLAIFAWPFVHHNFLGSGDTTSHVALGALIVTAATFRALLAYGALWLEIPLFAMGLITASLPHFACLQWNRPYLAFHLAVGIALCGLSALSAALTLPVLKIASPESPPGH
jgi:hypothetical protein